MLRAINRLSRILETKPYLRPFKAFSEADLAKQVHAKRAPMYANPHRSQSINPLIQSSLPSFFKQKSAPPPGNRGIFGESQAAGREIQGSKKQLFL
jgi:hypothetical protein